jgi:hypothetical protein
MSRALFASRSANKATLHKPIYDTGGREHKNLHTYGLFEIMFPEPGGLRSRKRGRESDDEFAQQGFQEHRTVRVDSLFSLQ